MAKLAGITLSVLLLSVIGVFEVGTSPAFATHNPNLFVSAEDGIINTFDGPMVVEIIIVDPDIMSLDESHGEPTVTVNGKKVRMVQNTDGNWYAYIADRNNAQRVDSTVTLADKGLDFGVFCDKNSGPNIMGISVSETEGIAIPTSNGITGATNGLSTFTQCSGTVGSGNQINVVREPKFPTPAQLFSGILRGQIGIKENVWPFIQLYDFSNQVVIQYIRASETQETTLSFADVGSFVDVNIDRTNYPQNSHVHLSVTDLLLNIDPTDEDSWTFSTSLFGPTIVYQAFDQTGLSAADGTVGAVDVLFDINRFLLLNVNVQGATNDVVNLFDNRDQQIIGGQTAADAVSFGGTFQAGSQPVTLTEVAPNAALFSNTDEEDQANIRVTPTAESGTTATINYANIQKTITAGINNAVIDIQDPDGLWKSGEEILVSLTDEDANLNSRTDEDLDVFDPNVAQVPTIVMGNPFTLESLASGELSGNTLNVQVQPISQRALLTSNAGLTIVEGATLELTLGNTFGDLYGSINEPATTFKGFNFFNYDIRSIQIQSARFFPTFDSVTSFDVDLTDGVKTARLSNGQTAFQGLVNLADATGDDIFAMNPAAPVTLIFTFHVSGNPSIGSSFTIPIVSDFFSFGFFNDGLLSADRVNNMIARIQVEEIGDDLGVFEGTAKYIMLNQLNILDVYTYSNLRPIDDDVIIVIHKNLAGVNSPTVSYNDLRTTGFTTITDNQEAQTRLGTISFDSANYEPGGIATVALNDLDLNVDSQVIDIFTTVTPIGGEPASDTVGRAGLHTVVSGIGTISTGEPFGKLFEIKFDGNRWLKSTVPDSLGNVCAAISGDDGLSSSGFTLIETGIDNGDFRGSFVVPNEYCSRSDGIIQSTLSTTLTAEYFDFTTSDGNSEMVTAITDVSDVALDDDNDGIQNEIDTLPNTPSDDFDDGATTGSITSRGDQILTIADEPAPDGVRVRADTSGGSGAAIIVACSGSAIYSVGPGDDFIISCGSVTTTVLEGTVEITFVASDGFTATTSLNAGNTITFDPETVTFVAAQDNSETTLISIDGIEIPVTPGDTMIDPSRATENLIDVATELGAQTSSLKQVSQILQDDNLSNNGAACGKLDAFVNQVSANKDLTQQEKDQLIHLANEIKSSIGC